MSQSKYDEEKFDLQYPIPPPARKMSLGGELLNKEEIEVWKSLHGRQVPKDEPTAAALLEACLVILNTIPNKKIHTGLGKDTYAIAGKISDFLKK